MIFFTQIKFIQSINVIINQNYFQYNNQLYTQKGLSSNGWYIKCTFVGSIPDRLWNGQYTVLQII